jgi:hypothetical protein
VIVGLVKEVNADTAVFMMMVWHNHAEQQDKSRQQHEQTDSVFMVSLHLYKDKDICDKWLIFNN